SECPVQLTEHREDVDPGVRLPVDFRRSAVIDPPDQERGWVGRAAGVMGENLWKEYGYWDRYKSILLDQEFALVRPGEGRQRQEVQRPVRGDQHHIRLSQELFYRFPDRPTKFRTGFRLILPCGRVVHISLSPLLHELDDSIQCPQFDNGNLFVSRANDERDQ